MKNDNYKFENLEVVGYEYYYNSEHKAMFIDISWQDSNYGFGHAILSFDGDMKVSPQLDTEYMDSNTDKDFTVALIVSFAKMLTKDIYIIG